MRRDARVAFCLLLSDRKIGALGERPLVAQQSGRVALGTLRGELRLPFAPRDEVSRGFVSTPDRGARPQMKASFLRDRAGSRCCHPLEQLTATSRPRFPPVIAKSVGHPHLTR